MLLRSVSKLLVSLSVFASSSLFAAPLVVNLANVQSNALFTDPANTVLTFDVGANSAITGFSFAVNLSAYAPSWLSELGLAVSDSSLGTGFTVSPASGNDLSGTASYAASYDLVALGVDFNVGADGILRLEFYEDVDDLTGPDGQWNFGTLTFNVEAAGGPDQPGEVPEPASLLLLGAGLGALACAGRRRAVRKPS
ncbi:VPLPA-CTERM sorting domain-containing protein [Massilia phyllosphaerae]|uniref:VPLPA-CTERM sorting domain-containing protein n=1 Tax=Massilia phyllosphaerae TaxID=3106034 RepID=UPI002B1CC7E0|nr:VPLPA-CTERM sorting domain-containing protein [Massilia sp. SGZ-792]